ncbi:MAG TPA: hypothetical protein VFV99_08310 [Kofleriaceae bacterium]|nr:hypothetical protein [Kofleriaceae bacterium]
MVAPAWRSWLPWCVVIAAGWTAIALYSYPGFTSYDSIEQLAQARGLMPLSDWHLPIMPLTWRVLDKVIAGPLLMVLLQCSLLLAGMQALLTRVLRPWIAVLATLAVFLWPPVFTLMAIVWKDSLMAGVLVASFAALTSARRGARIAALAGFFYAAMLRHNAIIAIAPMLVLVAPWPARQPLWRRRLAGLAITLVVFGAAQLANRALITERRYPFATSLATYDIAGMLRYADPLPDATLDRMLAGVPLVAHDHIQRRAELAWSPLSWFPSVDSPRRLMTRPATAAERDAVVSAWWRLIRDQPRAYLLARLRVMRELIGLRMYETGRWEVMNAAGEDVVLLAGYGIHIARPDWQVRLSWWLAELSGTSLLFRAWPYLLVALALAIAARRNLTVLTLVASGLVYEAALFVIAPSVDFRYSTWLVLCTLIAFALHLAQIRPSQNQTSRGRLNTSGSRGVSKSISVPRAI